MRELGYVDGKTVEIVYRSGEMNLDILEFAAQALVDAKVDVIAALSGRSQPSPRRN